MISLKHALDQLYSKANKIKAIQMKNSVKIDEVYLGISNPELDNIYKLWRMKIENEDRIRLATELWDSNIYEAKIVASKLLTQARISNDELVWEEILRWITTLDHPILADHVCNAGSRRLKADPSRLTQISNWVFDKNVWKRRSVLTLTMPWAKINNPKRDELEQRARIISWLGALSVDQEWLIQKAIANWLSSLSKHDIPAFLLFLEEHGAKMKPFAVNEACKFI